MHLPSRLPGRGRLWDEENLPKTCLVGVCNCVLIWWKPHLLELPPRSDWSNGAIARSSSAILHEAEYPAIYAAYRLGGIAAAEPLLHKMIEREV